MRIPVLLSAIGLAAAVVQAQDLTIDRALEMAKANNGNVRAAFLQYQASRANARSAFAAYLPTVTPAFEYDVTRTDTYTGLGKGLFEGNSNSSTITASWLILDSGARDAVFRRSSLARDVSELSALQTLRQTLFGVHSSFYEAVRAEKLHEVRQAQLDRATEIQKQTEEFAITGAGAKIDTYQAKADMLNAKASELTARNAVSNSRASLKAILGLPESEELRAISAPVDEQVAPIDHSLADAIREGLANRPDLKAQRLRVDQEKQNVTLAKIDQGFTWSLDARHTRSFSPDGFDHSALVFQVSIPLYDGARSAENLRSSRLFLDAERATLAQSERDALAEIESAFKEFAQNRERLEASTAALEAARINYQAAFESRQEGAGDLIQVITAQVSLTTAESNYIEAYYDTLISEVRLKLVTGQPLPGEAQ